MMQSENFQCLRESFGSHFCEGSTVATLQNYVYWSCKYIAIADIPSLHYCGCSYMETVSSS